MLAPTALLMLKAPVEGEVKTRLGAEIGVAAATRAYRALVEHQLRQLPATWRRHVCFSPENALPAMRGWLGEDVAFSPQVTGDLGARLTAACDEHFRRDGGPLVILGGDCPYLGTDRLLAAAAELATHDAILVPALDGGYCLIGLRRAESHLFQAIAWSRDTVLAETRERLRERRLSWKELEPAEDVDDGASWQRARDAFPHLDGAPA